MSLLRANFASANARGAADSARASVTQHGVDSNDLDASRVIVEFAPGDLHVQYVVALHLVQGDAGVAAGTLSQRSTAVLIVAAGMGSNM